jgi:hypothetical protein
VVISTSTNATMILFKAEDQKMLNLVVFVVQVLRIKIEIKFQILGKCNFLYEPVKFMGNQFFFWPIAAYTRYF